MFTTNRKGSSRKSQRSGHRYLRPQVEGLEVKTLLSTILLQDDFNGNSLDPAKWWVVLPNISGPPSVMVQNQHVELINRGHLVTASQFDPSQVGPLSIQGTWTFQTTTIDFQQNDYMEIVTRSDAVPSGEPYGATMTGVHFVVAGNGPGHPGRMWISVGGVNLAVTTIQMNPGSTAQFTVTDDGSNVSFTVQAGGQTRTIAGNTTFQGNANYIEFYNRQRGINSTSLVSLLDNVVVTGNPQTDLIASSLAWNDAQAGVDFGYEVKSARLPEPTNVALVWSQDTHFNLTGPDADTIAYITPAHEAIDTYAVSVAASMLAAPPPEAKYLLLVVDPYEKVQESDETNNVRYIPLVRKPDLEAVEVGINEFGIYYYYKVENEPLPAATSAHLYWGDHEDFRHANLTEAAAPNDIPSGQEPGTYSDGVYKANMRPAPLGTTHLFLVLDPDGTIDEARDGNNVSYVSMLIAPSVEVYFTDPRGNAVNQVYKGYDYKIWAKVMNNDVDDPINVRLRWDEIFTTIPYPHDPVSGGTLELTLPPSDEQSVELGTIRHYWDWIPEKAPGKAEQDIALGMMISLIDNFNTVVSEGTPPGYSDVLALAQTLISVLEAKLFAYPETTLTYRVSAEWASQRSVQAEKPLLLTVPQERRKWLADYVALNGLANYYTSYAIPLLIYFDPSNWMGYLLNEVRMLNAADNAWTKALDPPDPNFTDIAGPQATLMPEMDALLGGLFVAHAHIVAELEGLSNAEVTARNRADGASLAGDPYWESVQLIATANYASQSVQTLTRLIAIESLQAPYIANTIAPLAYGVVPYLQDHGLPTEEIRHLAQLGWTPEEIENLRQNLIQVGPLALETPDLKHFALSLSALVSANTAFESLAQGVRIRIEQLGLEVRDLTLAERSSLDTQQIIIQAGLDKNLPSQSLMESINAYIAEVRYLILETNNLDDLGTDLEFGYSALAVFQQFDTSFAGIRLRVDRLESEGRIGGDLAAELRNHLIRAEQHLAVGDFAASHRGLSRFTEVAAGLPVPIADDLTAYATYVSRLLGSGEPSPTNPVEGDYDGDRVTDLALYSYDPTNRRGLFHIRLSNFGDPQDRVFAIEGVGPNVIPISGDFDGDGIADIAVADPMAILGGGDVPNATVWHILLSSRGFSNDHRLSIPFGAAGVLDRPVPADFDGDGITDIATFRAESDLVPGVAQWFILPSRPNPRFETMNGAFSVVFGAPGGIDLPAPYDFDGDGRADIATFRPESDLVPGAAQWFILPSGDNDLQFTERRGGFPITSGPAGNADQPAVFDLNHDGRAEVVAFRPESDLAPGSAQWFVLPSSGEAPGFGSGFPVTFGQAGDIAAVGDYDGDNGLDYAVFAPGSGAWTIAAAQSEGMPGAETTEVFDPTDGAGVPVLSPLFFRLRATGNIPTKIASSDTSIRSGSAALLAFDRAVGVRKRQADLLDDALESIAELGLDS